MMELLKNWKVLLVLIMLVSAVSLIAFKGINYGIEFQGGVRIPITLEKSVDQDTMSQMIETIKLRINKYGLSQSIVRSLGDQQIVVEIPKSNDPQVIENVKRVLSEQGVFEAIIDGKQGVSGADVIAVGGASGEQITKSSDDGPITWKIDFVVSAEGGEKFARAALGKGGYPVLLFLDRPTEAVVVASREELGITGDYLVERELKDVLKKEGDDILLIYAEEFEARKGELAGRKHAIVTSSISPEIRNELANKGLSVAEVSAEEMKPVVKQSQASVGVSYSLSQWKAIGLLSAPVLSDELANGRAVQMFQINGPASGADEKEQYENAVQEIKRLKSIISGGKLPVKTIVGSTYSVAPSLGEQFLFFSLVGLLCTALVVGLIVFLRYHEFKVSAAIMATVITEITILLAVIGTLLGTIDLGAMAGMIAAIGTGVDDQIIISDEVLNKGRGDEKTKEKVSKAFYIVIITALVACASMLPLILSGIVDVMGFAMSTLVGIFIGVLFTRPAFGVVMEHMFKDRQAQ